MDHSRDIQDWSGPLGPTRVLWFSLGASKSCPWVECSTETSRSMLLKCGFYLKKAQWHISWFSDDIHHGSQMTYIMVLWFRWVVNISIKIYRALLFMYIVTWYCKADFTRMDLLLKGTHSYRIESACWVGKRRSGSVTNMLLWRNLQKKGSVKELKMSWNTGCQIILFLWQIYNFNEKVLAWKLVSNMNKCLLHG